MLRAVPSACQQRCSCWHYAVMTCYTVDLTNTIAHVWQQKWTRQTWLLDALFDSSQITLEMSSLKHNFLNKTSSDSKRVLCRPTAIALLTNFWLILALSETKIRSTQMAGTSVILSKHCFEKYCLKNMLSHARQLDMKDVADNPHPGVPRVDIKSSRNGFASPSRRTKPGALRSWHRQCLQLASRCTLRANKWGIKFHIIYIYIWDKIYWIRRYHRNDVPPHWKCEKASRSYMDSLDSWLFHSETGSMAAVTVTSKCYRSLCCLCSLCCLHFLMSLTSFLENFYSQDARVSTCWHRRARHSTPRLPWHKWPALPKISPAPPRQAFHGLFMGFQHENDLINLDCGGGRKAWSSRP